MVRWTCRRPGNRWSKWRRKWACRPRVRVEAEELADDLDRQHLAVGEDRRRAALAEPTLAAQVADEVVHEAEDGDDEGLQVHGRPSLRLNLCKERPGGPGAMMAPSATRSLGNPHTGLATEPEPRPARGRAGHRPRAALVAEIIRRYDGVRLDGLGEGRRIDVDAKPLLDAEDEVALRAAPAQASVGRRA